MVGVVCYILLIMEYNKNEQPSLKNENCKEGIKMFQDGIPVEELAKTRNTLENMFPEMCNYFALKNSFKRFLANSNDFE